MEQTLRDMNKCLLEQDYNMKFGAEDAGGYRSFGMRAQNGGLMRRIVWPELR